MTLGREIDDREASVAKPNPGFLIGPRARVVRAAVDHRIGHRPRGRRKQVGWGPAYRPQPGDTAH